MVCMVSDQGAPSQNPYSLQCGETWEANTPFSYVIESLVQGGQLHLLGRRFFDAKLYY